MNCSRNKVYVVDFSPDADLFLLTLEKLILAGTVLHVVFPCVLAGFILQNKQKWHCILFQIGYL